MSSYQFHFLNKRRLLACLVLMNCSNDGEAEIRARSLTGIAHDWLEIWHGEDKIYEAQGLAVAG